MPHCSIALQILPLGTEARLAVIDRVIALILERHPDALVTPFETVFEGEYEELMATLKAAVALAGQGHDNIFANVKINYGRIMTTDEKLAPFS